MWTPEPIFTWAIDCHQITNAFFNNLLSVFPKLLICFPHIPLCFCLLSGHQSLFSRLDSVTQHSPFMANLNLKSTQLRWNRIWGIWSRGEVELDYCKILSQEKTHNNPIFDLWESMSTEKIDRYSTLLMLSETDAPTNGYAWMDFIG